MTNNEKDAHAVAYAATGRLRWTRDKTQRIYVTAKADYDEANAEFTDVYDVLYEAALAKLESNDDEE
jgi:Zn-dependent metalloprotease